MRLARYTIERVTGSMMYRAARSFSERSLAEENTADCPRLRRLHPSLTIVLCVTAADAREQHHCDAIRPVIGSNYLKTLTPNSLELCHKVFCSFAFWVVARLDLVTDEF